MLQMSGGTALAAAPVHYLEGNLGLNHLGRMTALLGIVVLLVAGGLAGLVRVYGKGWPWYMSALVGFVLFWPGVVLLLFLYSALGFGWDAASSASVTHSLIGVVVGGIVMSAPFNSEA